MDSRQEAWEKLALRYHDPTMDGYIRIKETGVIDDDGAIELAGAIVNRVISDYKKALIIQFKTGVSFADAESRKWDSFFDSDWCHLLTMGIEKSALKRTAKEHAWEEYLEWLEEQETKVKKRKRKGRKQQKPVINEVKTEENIYEYN